MNAWSLKPVVSTTSVSPSQRPRESPPYCRMASGTCGTPVERDVADVVDVLLQDDHEVRVLQDVVVVVVAGRERRDAAVPDAAVPEVELLVAVGRRVPPSHRPPVVRLRRRQPCRDLRRDVGEPTVRRVDDHRRAPGRDHRRPPLHPEVVVGADVPARLGAARGRLPQVDVALCGALLGSGRLLLGQELLLAERLRPLERRQRGVVPDALQVRIAPRGPGGRRCLGLRRLCMGVGRHEPERRNRRRHDPRPPDLAGASLPPRVARCRSVRTRPIMDPVEVLRKAEARPPREPSTGRGTGNRSSAVERSRWRRRPRRGTPPRARP